MKFLVVLGLTFYLHTAVFAEQPAPKSDAAAEIHLKAVKVIEASGGRDRLVAGIPDIIEQGKAAIQKQCPDCAQAFVTEWGKRMTARLKVDDFVDVAARAYEKRFTIEELTELLEVVSSQKSEKPVTPSPALQKKLSALVPAIMGEITGGSTELGAKLGSEVGTEIEKEHPEYFPAKAKPEKN